jgi:hypothetical protein
MVAVPVQLSVLGVEDTMPLRSSRFVILLTLLIVPAPVEAAAIAIVNPGFEADVLGEGGIANTITGWDTSAGGGDGAFNPTAANYPGGAAPEGQNVAYANLSGNRVRQVLSAALEAETTYTLRVEVGRRLDHGFPGYFVQLLAGGVLLAQDDSLVPAAGTFLTSTVTFHAPAEHAQLGQPLEVKLLAKGVQANFDDVRLEAVRGPDAVCAAGTQVVDLATGRDADSNGRDDNWTVTELGDPSEPAYLEHPPFGGWRGNVAVTGPFNSGARYPVLGDGRWVTTEFGLGDAAYELEFTLDGSCPWPVLSLELDFDNYVELTLNGTVIFSNPGGAPAPWLSNEFGTDHPAADPGDGLLHPSCNPPVFRCGNPEDNFREIHAVVVDGPAFLDPDGVNTLRATVYDDSVVTGFLVTGGADTSMLSGATVRCCVPERPSAAVVPIFSDGFESGDLSSWSAVVP